MANANATSREIGSLRALSRAEAKCTRCPLFRDATQVVPGKGPSRARVMLVGEQPGDYEDQKGEPFVGPAGRILDEALVESGVDRKSVFLTNAVKHFKFEPRGKKRLHKRPNAYEIERCHLWYEYERRLVKPELIVALGATAGRSVFGRPVKIASERGEIIVLPEDGRGLVTIHPSYLLRIRDRANKAREYRRFVADLKIVAKGLQAGFHSVRFGTCRPG